jgi:hypothetical protein
MWGLQKWLFLIRGSEIWFLSEISHIEKMLSFDDIDDNRPNQKLNRGIMFNKDL